MSLIDIIVGARPNFIKVSPIIQCIERRAKGPEKLEYRLIHTGQHYDYELSRVFFDQLEQGLKAGLNTGGITAIQFAA